MMLSIPQHAVFMQRTYDSYHEQKSRAREAGKFIDYRIDDLRGYVLNNLGDQRCHYCRGPVRADTFALDHKIPPVRGGSFLFHNLAIVCKDCNEAKGHLDYVEFKELMSLLRSWSPFVRKNVLARLQAAGPLTKHLYIPQLQRLLQEGRNVDDDV